MDYGDRDITGYCARQIWFQLDFVPLDTERKNSFFPTGCAAATEMCWEKCKTI